VIFSPPAGQRLAGGDFLYYQPFQDSDFPSVQKQPDN
jgi:hypothetical protein